jgi:protein-disulfide isomerase
MACLKRLFKLVATIVGNMASRAERKEQARAARLASEASAARAATRRRNATLLGVVVLVALLVLAGAIAVSRSGGGNGSLAPQRPEVSALFRGVPQHGTQLGKPDAQFTMVEFVDLQCPFCRQYTLNALPTVIDRFVRPGRLKVDLKLLTFIGPDSVKAGKVAAAAAQQSRVWPFADLFYHQQGTENTGYVTAGFLQKIANATPGLNASKALSDANGAQATQLLNADEQLATTLGTSGTPAFFIRRGGGPYEPLTVSAFTGAAVAKALDQALKS